MIDMKKTGMRINQCIVSCGLSIRDVAQHLGFSSSRSVYKWLSGQTLPSLESLVLLSDLFGISMDELIIRQ